MGRSPREEAEGAIWHVWARGNNQRKIFEDDVDRLRYLLILREVVEERGWRCHAYCLMGNHVHLLVETPRTNLWKGMWTLQGSYARSYNIRYGRRNHLWGERYDVRRIGGVEHLWYAAAYIVLNPVKAGLGPGPERWPWSSYRATVGLEPVPGWLDADRLLGQCGQRPGGPDAAAFARFVSEVRRTGGAGVPEAG